MTFQEAKDLKLCDTVFFIIGGNNKVCKERVIGISLPKKERVDVTCPNPNNANYRNALHHTDVFLKEEDALRVILQKKQDKVISIKSELSIIRERLNTLLNP